MGYTRRLKRILGWERKDTKPQFNLNPEIYSQLKPFRLPLILIQFVMIIGTLGYVYLEDYTIIDAIFQSAYTFSTTGFGSLGEDEFSPAGVFFTVTLILGGFIILSFSVGVLVNVISKGNLLQLLKERSMLYKIARLRNHFVIFYHNEYTIQLAKQFKQSHIPFVVVDPSEDIEEISYKYNYPYFIKEEPFTEKAFLKTHLSSAKGVISLSKNISNNITNIASVRLYEKELGREPFLIICNAETQYDVERLKKLGADKVVAPPSLMAKRVSAMAMRPDMENVLEEFLYKKNTPIDMEEVYVPFDSWLVNKKLLEAHLRDKIKVSVIGITEKSGKFIQMPRGDTLITHECKLLIVGNQIGISKAKRLIRRVDPPKDFE